jgi:RHS repeat-associated protein
MQLTNFHFYNSKNYLYSKPIKGLKGFGGCYCFGFNGKEKDNETYGEGNTYDFGARIHDPRLGRFTSLDPLCKQFVGESNYSYAGNNPIAFADHKGKKKIYYIHVIELDGKQTTFKIVDNNAVKTVITYTRESIGVGNQTLYSTQVANKETFDTYQYIFINKQTGKQNFGEEKQGEKRSNNPIERWVEDNLIDKEKKGNYGGIGWISETGRGEETKKGDGKNIENIDDLTKILNLTKSAADEGGASALLNSFKTLKEKVQKFSSSQTVTDLLPKKEDNKSPSVDSVICNGDACKGQTVSVKDTLKSHSGPYKPVENK